MNKKVTKTAVEPEEDQADLPTATVERKRILDENESAESFFPDEFPGFIKFPKTFTLEMHQRFTKMIVESQKEPEADREPILIMGQDGLPYYFSLRNVRAGINFAEKLEVTDNRDGKNEKLDLENIGALPIEVAAWIGISATEYINRHTRFPRLFG